MKIKPYKISMLFLLLFSINIIHAQSSSGINVENEAKSIESQVIDWRKDFHQNPELSNREFETGKKIAAHLQSLGMEVTSEVAHTGVTGFLKGGQPGPTVALRADIDALPVKERVDIPFASKAKGEYLGEEVDVMHACGHDTHIAILMGVASIMAKNKAELKGNILFIFQPAEEGPPPGEEGGAELMLKEGIFKKYNPDVAFGLHINAQTPVGKIRYKTGGIMAASDQLFIKVKGKQAHGSRPWTGIDPIVASAQIIMGLQTVVSRHTELTNEAAVITIGKIKGGVRNNIIPETCELTGTIRTLDTKMQDIIHEKIIKTATLIAESSGAEAEVTIDKGYGVTYNNPELTRKMIASLNKSVGEENVIVTKAVTGAEDFSFYAKEVPSMFFFLGGMDPSKTAVEVAGHHTPDFRIENEALIHGIKALSNLTIDYMENH